MQQETAAVYRSLNWPTLAMLARTLMFTDRRSIAAPKSPLEHRVARQLTPKLEAAQDAVLDAIASAEPPNRPRRPSTKHRDLQPYIGAIRTWREITARRELGSIPYYPKGEMQLIAANDNDEDEGEMNPIPGQISVRDVRPTEFELIRAWQIRGQDKHWPTYKQIGGLRFAARHSEWLQWVAGEGPHRVDVCIGELIAYQKPGGGWSRATESTTGREGAEPQAPSSNARWTRMLAAAPRRDVKAARSPRLTAGLKNYPGRDFLRQQLAALGVDGSQPIDAARAAAGLPVPANDNRTPAALPYAPDDASELFMAGQTHGKGSQGWRITPGAIDLLAVSEDLAAVSSAVSPELARRLTVITRARNIAEIGHAFGSVGKTAENTGIRIARAALAEINSLVQNQGVRSLAA